MKKFCQSVEDLTFNRGFQLLLSLELVCENSAKWGDSTSNTLLYKWLEVVIWMALVWYLYSFLINERLNLVGTFGPSYTREMCIWFTFEIFHVLLLFSDRKGCGFWAFDNSGRLKSHISYNIVLSQFLSQYTISCYYHYFFLRVYLISAYSNIWCCNFADCLRYAYISC
jgi:hypothetical protein